MVKQICNYEWRYIYVSKWELIICYYFLYVKQKLIMTFPNNTKLGRFKDIWYNEHDL